MDRYRVTLLNEANGAEVASQIVSAEDENEALNVAMLSLGRRPEVGNAAALVYKVEKISDVE